MTVMAAIDDASMGLPYLRAEAEARMTSTVTVRRITTRTTQNETNGEEVPEWDDIYTGPFRLGGAHRGSSSAATKVVAGVEIQVATRVGHFPAAVVVLSDNDLIDITAGENAGLVLRILEADWADQQTAHRVPVVSADRPTEWEA